MEVRRKAPICAATGAQYYSTLWVWGRSKLDELARHWARGGAEAVHSSSFNVVSEGVLHHALWYLLSPPALDSVLPARKGCVTTRTTSVCRQNELE